eukprot:m.239570 g.239570  ORF g.239570 m.239570 type:complete len:1601 (-) comp17434_c0_seq10:4514-9316(-)
MAATAINQDGNNSLAVNLTTEEMAGYEFEELVQGARELLDLADVFEQQDRYDEAEEIYSSAVCRLQFAVEEQQAAKLPVSPDVMELLDQAEAAFASLQRSQFEERRAQAEDLLQEGEQFVIDSNWVEAKDCFIDACDYFMELESTADDRATRSAMSLKVMELLNRAEEMTELIEADMEDGGLSDDSSRYYEDMDHLSVAGDSSVPFLTRRRSDSAPTRGSQDQLDIPENLGSSLRRSRAGTMADKYNKALARTGSPPEENSSSEHLLVDQAQKGRIASLMTDQDEMAEATLAQLTGAPFTFASSLEVIIEDGPLVKACSTPVKRSVLGLVGYSLQSLGEFSPLRTLTINSFELQINAALDQSLAQGIGKLRQLTEVNLTSSGLTAAGCELLSKGLAKSKMLVTLILDMNTIGDMGLAALCENVLPTLTSLRLLSVKANGIGPEGCATLRNALEQGSSLYQLDLKGNDIGCEEVDKLIIGDKSQTILVSDKHEPPKGRGMPTCRQSHTTVRHVQLVPYSSATERRNTKRLKKKNLKKKAVSSGESHTLAPSVRMPRASHAVISSQATDDQSALAVAMMGAPGQAPGSPSTARKAVGTGPIHSLPSVTNEDFIATYAKAYQHARDNVKAPNILLVGQRGVGKYSTVTAVFCNDFKKLKLDDPKRPVEYRDSQGTFALWDTVSLDPSAEEDAATGIGCFITAQFNKTQCEKRVHAIWYIISSPVWQALDENYLRVFARRAHDVGCPLIVLINKADTMTTAQLDELRSNTLRALAHFKNFHGVFSSISDRRHLVNSLTMQLRTAACPDAVFDQRLEAKIEQEYDAKHELKQALTLSVDLLPETAQRSIYLNELAALRRKELLTSEIVRNQQAKFEQSGAQVRLKSLVGGRGKRWTYIQLTKMLRRIATAFEYLPKHVGAGDEPDLGREFTKKLGNSYKRLIAASGHLDMHTFTTLAILWALHLRQHRLLSLHTAQEDPVAYPHDATESAFASVLNKCRDSIHHLMEMYAIVTKHIEPPADQASVNLGKRPASIVILRAMEECSTLLFGSSMGVDDVESHVEAPVSTPSSDKTAVEHVVDIVCKPSSSRKVYEGFLASYRVGLKCAPLALLKALEKHFISHAYSENSTSHKVCERVCELVDYWIAEYFVQDFCLGELEEEEEDDQAMPSRDAQIYDVSWLQQFESSCGHSPPVRAALDLINTIKQSPLSALASSLATGLQKRVEQHLMRDPNAVKALPAARFMPLRQYDAQLLAAHLCYRDFSQFSKLVLRDFFEAKSPVRTNLIKFANQITYWVVENIVSVAQLEARAHVLLKLVAMANHLQGPVLRDLHGFMAVMTGLQLSHVSRLKKTWARAGALNPALMVVWETVLVPLAEPGSGMYHAAMDRVKDNPTGPSVPFLGSFLTGIERTRTNGKNKTMTDDSLEQAKFHTDMSLKLANIIEVIPKCQENSYPWDAMGLLPVLDEFFRNKAPTLYELEDRVSRNKLEDALNKQSLAIEPRNPTPAVTVEDGDKPTDNKPDSTHRFEDIEQAAQRAEAEQEDNLFDDSAPSGLRRPSSQAASMRRVSVASGGPRRRASAHAPPPTASTHSPGQSVRRLLSANESAV